MMCVCIVRELIASALTAYTQYIRNTFSAAKDSISINGMDSREMEAELAKAQEGEGTFRIPCVRSAEY